MKIEKTPQDDHQMKLVVEVEADHMEANKHRAARMLAQHTKIPGFRPGKAPYDVIRRHIGDDAILEQAIDILLEDTYPEILKEAEIDPGAPGSLTSIDNLDPPTFTFTIPLKPTVDLGKYRKVRLPYKYKAPDKARVDEEMESLRKMYATTETVDRKVEFDDYILVDVKGGLDEEEEGASLSEELSRSGFAVAVRKEDQEDEWPFPGFAKSLVGLKPGDSKTILHKFSKKHDNEALQAKNASFEVTVKTVQAVLLPPFNDEFAKTVGDFENLEALRETVKQNLENRLKSEYDDEYYEAVMEKIREGTELKYPPQVLEHEQEDIIEDIRQRLSQQGMELESYLKIRKMTMDKFIEEEVRSSAVKRLERSLLMDKISKEEEIRLKKSDISQEYGATLSQLQMQGLDLSRVKGGKKGQQELAQMVAAESANRLMVRQILERIKDIATGEIEKAEKAAKKEAGAKKEAAIKDSRAEKKKTPEKNTARKTTALKTGKFGETKPKTQNTSRKKATKED
ncbi:MAG: trigger factor [Anaerolineales bacterium]|nr:trigger factor [Anaerolineales bacterium]